MPHRVAQVLSGPIAPELRREPQMLTKQFDSMPDVRVERARPSVNAALERFPRLKNFKFIIQQRERIGDEPRIESFSANEARNPNPGTRTLELRGGSLQGKNLENAIVGDMLHHLGSNNPVNDSAFRILKDQFIDKFRPEELLFAETRFMQHKTRHPEDERSFEQWFDTVWADMWIGGLIAPINSEFLNNAPTVLTKEQRNLVSEMEALLKKR